MIVVTGARGFIASNLVEALNKINLEDIILVDELLNPRKSVNLQQAKFSQLLDRENFLAFLEKEATNVDFIFHLGARTDTTEQSKEIFDKLNLSYSKEIFKLCTQYKIPLIYASSAATYGDGSLGYDDKLDAQELTALNPYGQSKLDFDIWLSKQEKKPPFWCGLKFFNVYGKHEEHKDRMASVVYHAYKQIKETGKMQLFASHNASYKDGEQARDFIYVEDVVKVMLFFFQKQQDSGIYNLGTGKARTFNDLVLAVFKTLNLEAKISYIPTPIDIRASYQYFTQAEMSKLREAGYEAAFLSLEEGIADYVINYLEQ
ncbi:MAG: ADP-glyceromanno-heptose 6-epimerase [Chitinophagales bacterium]|nr:ADP-glyceromanno-heptose 6-epimerase [Chitinophagales bacterium]